MSASADLKPTMLMTYAGERHAGYSPDKACRAAGALDLCDELERAFLGRARAGGRNAMLPTRADDDCHLTAVRRECGVFPTMPRGRA